MKKLFGGIFAFIIIGLVIFLFASLVPLNMNFVEWPVWWRVIVVAIWFYVFYAIVSKLLDEV